MKQTSRITRDMTAAQEAHAATQRRSDTVLYRLYTEDKANLPDLVLRYFAGATLLFATGIYAGGTELARVIDILGTRADLQNIMHLAGDIREVNKQTSVIVTWSPVSRFDVYGGGLTDVTNSR